ncbi:pseudaminic acid cytidylyltransferase [Qipengyuania flava]|uniref:pseudaminic acid cytidylyltransferase n=1 Tax=Qipengyuania flava TaxID=192812 RepID=UPI00273D4FE2|nr:pseudaminic acid cytidylyltransferase [Qipengyuania flava]
MSVCVIPARGGSKRIPGKNIRLFAGRPMISWSIEKAKKAGCFDRVVVSTDDHKVAEIAKSGGAEVPFLRSPKLSDDFTPTKPVVADAIDQLDVSADTPVCCLYATAPFVQSDELSGAFEALLTHTPRFVVSVTTFPFPIQRALHRSSSGYVEMIDPEHIATRSQDLPETWHDAGQFYWALASEWKDASVGIFSADVYGFPIPRFRVQDIDTEEDWKRAEILAEIIESRR